jgi:hypothetical protein
MRPDNYIQKFEDETRGTIVTNKSTIFKIFMSITLFSFIMVLMIANNKKNISVTQDSSTMQLNTHFKVLYKNIPTSTPSYTPTMDDDDDIMGAKNRKSKYPTRLPKKDVSTTMFPTQDIQTPFTTESPTQSFTMSGSQMSSESPIPNVQPTVILVTDDFHVTPIVVINTEEQNKHHLW